MNASVTTDTGVAPSPAEPGPTPRLRERAVRSSALALTGNLAGLAMKFGKSIILTRLLFPEAFGLMALVGVVMTGLQMMSDFGIGPSIVQHKDGEKEGFLRTAWTLSIVRAFGVWIVCCAVAWPVSRFYGQPELAWLVPVAGLQVVVTAFRTTSISVLRRKLVLGRVMTFLYAQELLELLFIVGLAWWTENVWAIVIGTLAGSLVATVAGHFVFPGIRHRFAWDRTVLASIASFGKWILISTFLTFLARKGDSMLLGALIPIGTLGVYSIALVLSGTVRDVITGLSTDVLFPVISETTRTDPAALEEKVGRARSLVLRVALLALASVAIGAPLFFRTFFDHRYERAAEMAQYLVIPAWFGVLNVTASYVLLALGDSKPLTVVNATSSLATWWFACIGLLVFDVPGFIVGMGAALLVTQLITQRYLRRRNVSIARQDLAFTGLMALVALGGVGAVHALVAAFPDTSRWLIDVPVAVVFLGIPGAMVGREIWKNVLRR